MANVYTRVQFMRLRPDSGATRILAYTDRSTIFDRRLGIRFDYGQLDDDLVHTEILHPEPTPFSFQTTEALANAIDAAEFGRVRLALEDRVRRPQIGAVVIVALPPDSEITLDEAIEVLHCLVDRIRDGRLLVIHAAIHEPALIIPGAVTRHGHLLVPMREFKNGAFGQHKIRTMFARPRCSPAPNARACFVAEGIAWPQLTWEIQQTLFTECGIDLIVDPIAPYSEPHWTQHIYRNDPKRVEHHRSLARHLNREAIHAEPAALVEKLLRGRSHFQIAELRRFIAKFVDAEEDRQHRLNTILGDPTVLTSAEPGAVKPRFATTGGVQDLLVRAAGLVDRAAEEKVAPAIHAVTAPDHAGVVAAIHDLLRTKQLRRSARAPRLLCLGVNQSDAEHLALAVPFARPVVATIKEALKAPSGGRKRTLLRRGGIVVLPRAEAIDDQSLATLLMACQESQGPIILGHDQSRKTGIVCRRLAVYSVEQLAAPEAPTADNSSDAKAIEKMLRCGLIGQAINQMAQQGLLIFAPTKDGRGDAQFDFVVCGDPRQLADTEKWLQARRAREDGSIAPVMVQLPRGPIVLCQDQWIVFTQTDYLARPPCVRAGELAKIVEIDADRNTIRALLPDQEIALIDLKEFPHIRSGFAISIREARQIKRPYKLRIEISSARHAWAGLLLATRQQQASTVILDPQVARDVQSLITAVRASLPGALPHQLAYRPDPNAELAKTLTAIGPDPIASKDFELENMPEPDLSQPVEKFPQALPTNW
jgi:hypothetical protein